MVERGSYIDIWDLLRALIPFHDLLTFQGSHIQMLSPCGFGLLHMNLKGPQTRRPQQSLHLYSAAENCASSASWSLHCSLTGPLALYLTTKDVLLSYRFLPACTAFCLLDLPAISSACIPLRSYSAHRPCSHSLTPPSPLKVLLLLSYTFTGCLCFVLFVVSHILHFFFYMPSTAWDSWGQKLLICSSEIQPPKPNTTCLLNEWQNEV